MTVVSCWSKCLLRLNSAAYSGLGSACFLMLVSVLAMPSQAQDFEAGSEVEAASQAASEAPHRVVVVMQSAGFEHPVVRAREDGGSVVQDVWEEVDAADDDIEVTFLRDVTELFPDLIHEVEVVSFYTTGNLPMSDEQIDTLIGWIEDGGNFLGLHVATDTFHDDPRYSSMINGSFNGHPWNADTVISVKVHEPGNPLVWMYADPEVQTFREEIYQFKNYDPANCRVIMSLDMERSEGPDQPYHVPICWVRTQGEGRVFYSSLGHREDVWRTDPYRQHLHAAVHWLLGDFDVDTTPNPELQARESEIARALAGE